MKMRDLLKQVEFGVIQEYVDGRYQDTHTIHHIDRKYVYFCGSERHAEVQTRIPLKNVVKVTEAGTIQVQDDALNNLELIFYKLKQVKVS